MQQEGRWIYSREKKGDRVPRRLIASIDQPEKRPDADPSVSLLEDEMARKALLAVEHSDLPRLIVSLPDKLKAVVLLIFWEDRTEKDTARLLCITDRTVRYRLKRALRLLYRILEADFVAYFHAFEEDIPEESQAVPILPTTFRIAIESANTRIAADQNPSTHLPQVAEAPSPYQLNKPSTEEI